MPMSAAAAAVDDADDMDCSMPELGCDFTVADLGCEADVDDEAEAEAAMRWRAAQAPRRLSLQQRRRLNLYSRPAPLPTLNAAAAEVAAPPVRKHPKQQHQGQPQTHETPTIHEEDSGFGSVASPGETPEVSAEDVDMPSAGRGRTLSEPPDSADSAGPAAGGAANRPSGMAARLRTVSHSTTSRWPKAMHLVFQNLRNDMWRDMPVSKMPEETVIRHRYNAHKRQWIHDTVRVKIESAPFNRGAMRECFRLKKQSGFSKFDSWHSRACNYVAKRYIEPVDPGVYFEDARLQMNAKLWAQEYNRHHPPKKVDIMQMYVIEFKDREGSPLYHLEHHIEGNYVKHNSNSGFVDENARRTPHALSHFTFERSGHQLIVVDIQGVDDIYTDPQIHTAEGTEYGDGNLGVRGMALFFSSHVCNDICLRLKLSRFDLAPSEISEPPSPMLSNITCVRGEIFALGSPISPPSILMDDSSACGDDDDGDDNGDSSSSGGGGGGGGRHRRRRITSGDEMTPEEELSALSAALKRRERPSCVDGNLRQQQLFGQQQRQRRAARSSGSDSGSEDASCGGVRGGALPGMPETRCRGPILGRIHHELARLHDAGRLVAMATESGDGDTDPEGGDRLVGEADTPGQLEGKINWQAAVFHEQLAAQLGVVEAALNLARLHLGLQTDCLGAAVRLGALTPTVEEGHRCMEAATRLGDRTAMLYLARAHDAGDMPGLERNWDRAAHYYQIALATSGQTDREGGYDSLLDTPAYQLRGRLAELYLRGGHGLDADPATSGECYSEAAEEAMADGNGKLAAKYYALAEEAAAMVPDEGEGEGEGE